MAGDGKTGGEGGGSGIGAFGSVNVLVAFVPLPPLAGVELYEHVGGIGDGGGRAGGADGGWHVPSQSTMYSTYTKLPSYGFSSTVEVAVVSNVYVLSGLGGRAMNVAHSK